MSKYEVIFTSNNISTEHAQKLVNRLNHDTKKEKNAYKLLKYARKKYDSIQNDMTLEMYDSALNLSVYWADRVDALIFEIESMGGVIS